MSIVEDLEKYDVEVKENDRIKDALSEYLDIKLKDLESQGRNAQLIYDTLITRIAEYNQISGYKAAGLIKEIIKNEVDETGEKKYDYDGTVVKLRHQMIICTKCKCRFSSRFNECLNCGKKREY